MILTSSRITVNGKKVNEFVHTMDGLLACIRNAPGCLDFELINDAVDENSFLMITEWETEADWLEGFRSRDFVILRKAIALFSVWASDFRVSDIPNRGVTSLQVNNSRHRAITLQF